VITIVGVSHGYQCFTNTWPPGGQSAIELEPDERRYQTPFRDWLLRKISDGQLCWIFEEWPLKATAGVVSTAEELVSHQAKIRYLQVDAIVRPYDDQAFNDAWREVFWVRRIKRIFHPPFNNCEAMLIVGDNHSASLHAIFEATGFQVRTIRERDLKAEMR
jgi:hypothetical protein